MRRRSAAAKVVDQNPDVNDDAYRCLPPCNGTRQYHGIQIDAGTILVQTQPDKGSRPWQRKQNPLEVL
jgi:hypothetical protein